MIKIGHLIPIIVVKALPDYDSYLVLIAGGELLALLPKKYTSRPLKVGDITVASVFTMQGSRIVLTQRSPQFLRKIVELAVSPLLQEGKVVIKRAAMASGSRFAKVSVASLNGVDPVKQCLPYLKEVKQYTDDTITLVRYSEDMKEYIVSALAPAPAEKVRKVLFFPSIGEADVYVDRNYTGMFLGEKGKNVATAAKLVGVKINITTF